MEQFLDLTLRFRLSDLKIESASRPKPNKVLKDETCNAI